MILRSATSADVEALLDVQEPGAVEGLGHIFSQDQYPFPREAIGSRWLAEIVDPKINVYLYTEHGGTIRGFAAVRDHELLHFGTALDTWGTGLASGFHDVLLDATARRTTRPTLMLRVFEENLRARRFYEKHGWQLTGRSSRTTFPPHPLLLEYNRRLTQSSR
ncbi:hypothetical protein GCM10022204_10890 [Microlunatus aurantiacus]|uniref:N-acetyltransferase domain-containing protein n=1 Tax=Microlunatus aurantiacus TaxID=446786 RepID=A0ABP7D0D7_9ACTN